MYVLGIESSCDDTAAAVVDGDRRILANEVLTQLEEHRPFGGIVPEIAARSHLDYVDSVVASAMKKAGLEFAELDAIAATAGPGLIGGLLVGVMTGKAIAQFHGKPFIAVNHLAGHALTPRLADGVAFPYLLLLVSGGHCQLLVVEAADRFRRLGTTIDDALGEAFDKTAKMLGLGYPGGPAVEAAAANGDPKRFALPRPMRGKPGCDFSFSGLKTAVRHAIEGLPLGRLLDADVADLCASFQAAAAAAIVDRTGRALDICRDEYPMVDRLVVAGGVAANAALRAKLVDLADKKSVQFSAPPLGLCTDNGAMIAWAGMERLRAGLLTGGDDMTFKPRPRWPLDPDAPTAAYAGAKA